MSTHINIDTESINKADLRQLKIISNAINPTIRPNIINYMLS